MSYQESCWRDWDDPNFSCIEEKIPIVKSITKETVPDYETTILSDIKSLGVEVGEEANKDFIRVKNAFNDIFAIAKIVPIAIIGIVAYKILK